MATLDRPRVAPMLNASDRKDFTRQSAYVVTLDPERDLPDLAEEAARQWTGTFNPRPFDAAGALEIYSAAY